MSALAQFLLGLDRSLFGALNSIAGRSGILDWFFRLGADDHIIPIILAILALLVLLTATDGGRRREAFRCLLCATIAFLISMAVLFLLNSVLFRPRPFTTQSVNLLFYRNTDSSFPSNAATAAFSLSFAIVIYRRRLGAVMLTLSCYLGLCRVAAGVHYPLDITAGLLLGLASASLGYLLEPAYGPLARRLASLEERLLAAWVPPGAQVEGRRGG